MVADEGHGDPSVAARQSGGERLERRGTDEPRRLSVDDLVTLAATAYTDDPGPMPTLTPQGLAASGHVSGATINQSHGPYNQNQGTLPSAMINGCLYTPDSVTFGYNLVPQNLATFTDLQDGILSAIPWVCDDGS